MSSFDASPVDENITSATTSLADLRASMETLSRKIMELHKEQKMMNIKVMIKIFNFRVMIIKIRLVFRILGMV